MGVFRVALQAIGDAGRPRTDEALRAQIRDAGGCEVSSIVPERLYFIDGDLTLVLVERVVGRLIVDPVTERAFVATNDAEIAEHAGQLAFEIHPRPGVMDPVAASVLAELRSEGIDVHSVRTARRYILSGLRGDDTIGRVARLLSNDCVEQVVIGTAGVHPAVQPAARPFRLRHVPVRDLTDPELVALARKGHLFLNLAEMQAIQAHYRALKREPTDLELETIAQTWSEHCVHKTLKSAVQYTGPDFGTSCGEVTRQFSNLLKDTIARATDELIAEKRGPICLSVFKDNAGVIAFDDRFGVAFKVETHNRPSAIEPFGGAATGIGGCIRDVLGCGLGAKPIASTDVFCVAPSDWPEAALPKGVLHPRRILRGIVDGVGEYGNRMGIPTVNGAVQFDPRYLGNPLVFCGCIGLIPRDRVEKRAQPGDCIVVVGGRTGRDGIHGATFSSGELTDSHADEFSHAVQIGNAIEEKRVLDAVLRAREFQPPGAASAKCLYSAITDCGAGGLSSAVGEMAEELGAVVDLEKAPLKYAGLTYDEIWISEAQERMVLAVPSENLDLLLEITRAEDVEATVIGRFADGGGRPKLTVRYAGTIVGEIELKFLHEGLPKPRRAAQWKPLEGLTNRPKHAASAVDASPIERLLAALAAPSAASKDWIIRRYDHEVQGGSVVKPHVGRGRGPSDAAVLRPLLTSHRGIAIGCGLVPQLSDLDPYWMAIAAIDEALCNITAVGADPRQAALLDNFCWGRTDDPQQMGALVRACQACYDGAKAFGAPFISGKDSLNNEFALDPGDIDSLVSELRAQMSDLRKWGYPQKLAEYRIDRSVGPPGPTMSLSSDSEVRRYEMRDGASEPQAQARGADASSDSEVRRYESGTPLNHEALLAAVERRIRETGRLGIPPTLLISAIALVDDVRRCVTSDLKTPGGAVCLVGGLPVSGFELSQSHAVRCAVHDAIAAGVVAAVHDACGGWLPAAAEMAIAGARGMRIDAATDGAFEPQCAAFVVELRAGVEPDALKRFGRGVAVSRIGTTATDDRGVFSIGPRETSVADLARAWRG